MQTIRLFVSLGILFSFSLSSSNLVVAFNQQTKKYHYTSCKWAKKCTVHCVEMKLEDAMKQGGVPCKVCRPPRG